MNAWSGRDSVKTVCPSFANWVGAEIPTECQGRELSTRKEFPGASGASARAGDILTMQRERERGIRRSPVHTNTQEARMSRRVLVVVVSFHVVSHHVTYPAAESLADAS